MSVNNQSLALVAQPQHLVVEIADQTAHHVQRLVEVAGRLALEV